MTFILKIQYKRLVLNSFAATLNTVQYNYSTKFYLRVHIWSLGNAFGNSSMKKIIKLKKNKSLYNLVLTIRQCDAPHFVKCKNFHRAMAVKQNEEG